MSFIAEHAATVAAIMGSLVTLVGFLLLMVFQGFVKNTHEHQLRQDQRLADLENGSFGSRLEHLHETLQRLLEELKEERKERHNELDREREERKALEQQNREDHNEIKSLIRRGVQRLGEAVS